MSKNYVIILTLTLITLITFVGVVLYQTAFKSTLPETTQQQIAPLDPELDSSLIKELENSLK